MARVSHWAMARVSLAPRGARGRREGSQNHMDNPHAHEEAVMRVSIGRRALFDRTQRGALVRVSGRAHSNLARLAVIKPAGGIVTLRNGRRGNAGQSVWLKQRR
jgi:hypothetical protein